MIVKLVTLFLVLFAALAFLTGPAFRRGLRKFLGIDRHDGN